MSYEKEIIKTALDCGWKQGLGKNLPDNAEPTTKYQKGDVFDIECAKYELLLWTFNRPRRVIVNYLYKSYKR